MNSLGFLFASYIPAWMVVHNSSASPGSSWGKKRRGHRQTNKTKQNKIAFLSLDQEKGNLTRWKLLNNNHSIPAKHQEKPHSAPTLATKVEWTISPSPPPPAHYGGVRGGWVESQDFKYNLVIMIHPLSPSMSVEATWRAWAPTQW